MASPLQRDLVVVTGKGGVGKSTVAAALGVSAAREGRRTVVVELGEQRHLPALFERAAVLQQIAPEAPAGESGEPNGSSARSEPADASSGAEVALAENLWSLTIDPDRALLEWLQRLGGRVPGRILANSGTFQYFAGAAPGAKELVSMVKVWELTQVKRWRRRARGYDLVVLDAPATGHALGLLRSPHTFGAIARVGPVFGQAQKIRELLEDPGQTSYLAVAQASEMAVGETLELKAELRAQLGCELSATIVNATLPRRFAADELARIARLNGDDPVVRSAVEAAHAVHERGRSQQRQIARLRRAGLSAISVPFVFAAELDLEDVRRIGASLAKRL
ncbi:MAG TPA: ArsA-related P-loop ATPase [Solirubrobacteraceae bacterium]|nr:ArsA-related P-loop ATPase [Solirubrobacteraceae bacterium]